MATSVDIQGVVGQGTADWSPDGAWIVTGGRDQHGEGLFKIPVDGGEAVRLVPGEARNPVWSPRGDLIVYAIPFGAGGGTFFAPSDRMVHPFRFRTCKSASAAPHRFLRDGTSLVYLQNIETKDFWLVDLATNTIRQLTQLNDRGFLNTFDITPDGKHLVFDRSQQNSDVVLIDLQNK